MTRKSRPRRTCKLCKYQKYMGNGKDRRPPRDRRRLQDRVPRALSVRRPATD